MHKRDRWTRRTFAWLLKEGERHSGMEFSARKLNWEFFPSLRLGSAAKCTKQLLPGSIPSVLFRGISFAEGLDFYFSLHQLFVRIASSTVEFLYSLVGSRTIPFNKPWKREGYHHLHICHLLVATEANIKIYYQLIPLCYLRGLIGRQAAVLQTRWKIEKKRWKATAQLKVGTAIHCCCLFLAKPDLLRR